MKVFLRKKKRRMSLRTMYGDGKKIIRRVKIIEDIILEDSHYTLTLMSWTTTNKLALGKALALRLVQNADVYTLNPEPLTPEVEERLCEEYEEMYITSEVPPFRELFLSVKNKNSKLNIFGKGTKRTIRRLLGEWEEKEKE